MPNTRTIGPLEVGTKPYLHWCLSLLGFKLMRTPVTTMLYRPKGNKLRPLPFTERRWIEKRRES